MLPFQGEQIAHAGLIEPAPIVDDKNVTALRMLERFEDHVDTADVTHRKNAPLTDASWSEGSHCHRRAPDRYTGTQAGVGQLRRAQAGEARWISKRHDRFPSLPGGEYRSGFLQLRKSHPFELSFSG